MTWRSLRGGSGRSPALAAATTLLFLSGAAVAQTTPAGDVPQSNEMRAERHFKTGKQKYDAGHYDEACAEFAESLRLGPQLGTLLNLALCHETTGKVATAWHEFHHGAAWAAQNGQRDRRDYAMQHIRTLETRLPRVVLHLPSSSAIAELDVDGEPLPETRWYLPLYLDPGEHAVAVHAPGKRRTTVSFRVTTSMTDQIVTIPALQDDEAIAAPAPAPKPAPPPPAGGRRTAGLVVLGIGGATLVASAVLGAITVAKLSDAEEQCAGDACTPAGVSAYHDAGSFALATAVAAPVGLAAVLVGGFFAFGGKRDSAARVSVGPTAVSIRGHF